MSSDINSQFQVYKDDSRIACQYGAKCYQKNPQHHSKYKHPPKREKIKPTIVTSTKRKNLGQNEKQARLETSQRKLQKIHESSERNVHKLSPSPQRSNDIANSDEDNNENSSVKTETLDKDVTQILNSNCSSKSVENITISHIDAQKVIKDLFLVEMPTDFFQFYEFCKNVSKDDPLLALKSVGLKLVGPYDVLNGDLKTPENEDDKEKCLTHWRYYYDPPEFQTIVKCNDKEGLHFGYWRDNVIEKPAFVAKNQANMNCIFEPVAENIFGTIDVYLQSKVKSANPFEKTTIMRLHSQLKSFAKQHNITLAKNTLDMQLREKRVVARTFHKIGIVVPYDKKTQLGYRDLAVTDNDLQKLLKQIEEANADERKTPISKLDEIVRLATIAADECDFGTCLELGHDLFANGNVYVQTRALHMLSIAYTHLQRLQLLKILKAHLNNRKKGCELSII